MLPANRQETAVADFNLVKKVLDFALEQLRETNIGRLHSSGQHLQVDRLTHILSLRKRENAHSRPEKPLWLLTNTRQASAWFRKLVTTIRKAEYIAANGCFLRKIDATNGQKKLSNDGG
jgi:hypothetical protein